MGVGRGDSDTGSLFANEDNKEINDAVDTFATHASIVYDVTDTECRAQNGSAHGRVRTSLQRQLIIIMEICKAPTPRLRGREITNRARNGEK